MKRELTATGIAGLIFLVVMIMSMFVASGMPIQQLDPTEAEGTVQALVDGYFEGTQQAQLEATAQIRFQEAVRATIAADPQAVQEVSFTHGSGAIKDFWQVYFTSPVGSNDRSLWVEGADGAIAAAIDNVSETLDIAAFELNNEVITEAIMNAHERGVEVRIVTDDEHGTEDDDSTIVELEAEGIPIIDDGRSALMHNKFMIMDSREVWMGSMNYTQNGTYRNNNNMLAIRHPNMVDVYQLEFNEMFERGEFGPRSDDSNMANFTADDGTTIQVLFASENEVIDAVIETINGADEIIRFMTFSYTQDDLGQAMLALGENGIELQGVFETTGSGTRFSEMTTLFCAGHDMRRDGNRGILHHKVIIVDDQTVITGSFNFSANATESNDENLVIISNPQIAELYLAEFARVQSIASPPDSDDISCE